MKIQHATSKKEEASYIAPFLVDSAGGLFKEGAEGLGYARNDYLTNH